MTDTTGYLAFFVVICTYIGANAYCHLISRDDENILSSYIDQSDDTINLLQYMHTKQQRWPRALIIRGKKIDKQQNLELLTLYCNSFLACSHIFVC